VSNTTRKLLVAFCVGAVLSSALPAIKQSYVLGHELIYPDHYMFKSMSMNREIRAQLVAQISSIRSGDLFFCSRTGYDASLYLLAEIIRSGAYEGKRVAFPSKVECDELNHVFDREGAVLFFGGRQPIYLKLGPNSNSRHT